MAKQSNGPGKETGAEVVSRRLETALAMSKTLKAVIKECGLSATIQGREYLTAPAWGLLGWCLHIHPRIEWVRRIDEEGNGYEARASLLDTDGGEVSAAEAEARKEEKGLWSRHRYAIRSMAQTRAAAKAFRIACPWFPALMGYEATPAEEIPADALPTGTPPPPCDTGSITVEAQRHALFTRMDALKFSKSEMRRFVHTVTGKHNSHDFAPADWEALNDALREAELTSDNEKQE